MRSSERTDDLCTEFGPVWERYHRYHTLDGAVRRQPAHQERANAGLARRGIEGSFS